MSATSSADGQSVITNIAATINGSSVQSSAPNDTTQTVPNNPATTTTINASSSTTSAANPNPSATTTTVAPPPVNTNKIDPVLGQSKDAQTMISVLKDMGIDEYEPKIVNQLLEFSYRYLTNLLDDARAFSSYAGKKTIDADDIKMAIRSKVDYSFTTTPPRDLLMEISKAKNKNPLPSIRYHSGIRLPSDRFCLHAQNYVLKTQTHNIPSHQHLHMQYQHQHTAYQQQQQQNESAKSASMYQQQHEMQPSFMGSSSTSMPIKRHRTDDEDYDA